MKRVRKAKAGQGKPPKSESVTNPATSGPTREFIQSVQSVLAEAESQIAELRRTIEWTKTIRHKPVPITVIE